MKNKRRRRALLSFDERIPRGVVTAFKLNGSFAVRREQEQQQRHHNDNDDMHFLLLSRRLVACSEPYRATISIYLSIYLYFRLV
jgi:hypothetical protein